MLVSTSKPESSKELYFLLNNSFHLLTPPCSSTYKIAGLYSIHRNGVCYYVGQSQNLPSRISTHLSGKYKDADEVRVVFMCETVHPNFFGYDKSKRADVLVTNEIKLIQLLNPIENLKVDYDSHIDDSDLFVNLVELAPKPPYFICDIGVLISGRHLNITDSYAIYLSNLSDSILVQDHP